MITFPDPNEVNILWAHDHELYLRTGRYSFFGPTPRSLYQILLTDRPYWFEHIVGPVNEGNWKGPVERAIIEILAPDPGDMVRRVAEHFPPPEDICAEFGIDETDECTICDRPFSDELLHDAYLDALADMQAEIDVESRYEEIGGADFE